MEKKKAVIFIVNSLCNGGAERVVTNMANGFSNKYKVFIICVYNKIGYEINDNISIISINENKLSNFKKLLFLPIIAHKISKNIDNISNEYEVKLISSHLIYSNIISKVSKYRKKIIDVIHVSYKVYDTRFHFIFKKCLQLLYNNVPIVTVSKGCENELLNNYKIKPLRIKTIYNPIILKNIDKKLSETYDFKNNFILFVGRLDKPKRPELLIDIFYKGKFYEKYDLHLVGVGPYEELLKNKVKEYGITDKVIFDGWQENVYKFMNKAKVLVNCSNNEAFPMTMIEAFASNCPVVSFDIDYGPNEILTDDLVDYLAEKDNIEDIICKINNALKFYPQNLRTKVEKFDVANINNEYLLTVEEWNLERG